METKDLKECILGLRLLLLTTKRIMADGKINISDLPVLVSLAQQSQIVAEAFAGLKNIPAEIKDLDAAEAQEILAQLYMLAKELKEA